MKRGKVFLLGIDFYSHPKYNKSVNESEVKRLSPRTGRPKLENPITERFSICLDRQTKQWLDAYCEKQGISRSEAIREGLKRLSDEQKK